MDERGRWSLAPAYDLTHARGTGYTRRPQMSFAGKTDDFTLDDLLDVGRRFGLRSGGREILARIGAALEAWPEHAAGAGIPGATIDSLEGAFRRHCLPR